MNIALTAHDAKKELMVQFCIAYCGILSRHNLCATGTTGKLVEEATGLSVHRFFKRPTGRRSADCGAYLLQRDRPFAVLPRPHAEAGTGAAR